MDEAIWDDISEFFFDTNNLWKQFPNNKKTASGVNTFLFLSFIKHILLTPNEKQNKWSRNCFLHLIYCLFLRRDLTYVQSNSVITNSTGPWKYVRYNREIVITVKVYVVKVSFGTRKAELYLFLIVVNSF